MPSCSICCEKVRDVNALFLHFKVVHGKSKACTFRCGERNCPRTYSNWYSFKKHILTHKLSVSIASSDNQQASQNYQEGNVLEFSNVDTTSDCADGGIACSAAPDLAHITSCCEQQLLTYVSKLYANRRLPRSFVQEVVEDTRDLFSGMLNAIKPALSHSLHASNLTSDVISKVESVLDICEEPFAVLRSEHHRFKALRASGCFIESVDWRIGERLDNKFRGGHSVREITEVVAKFIPLRNVLEKVFSLPGVLSNVKSYVRELEGETGVLRNFVQGELWRRKKALHFTGKTVFPLFVYYDDFEVNNPLGSHAGIQKLGAVYYSIPCFPSNVGSLVENIFLAMLFHTSDRPLATNERVFQILVDEINYLQRDGILVSTETGSERIYFSLGLLLGDNLGLNTILGFVQGFNANYYCRLCKMSKEDARKDFKEKKLRRETYTDDVHLTAKESGIRELSVWNKVDYFETSENFVADWLHEGPEGTVGEDMNHIVHYYVCKLEPKEMRLPLNLLNARLKSFNYARNSISNVPPLISHEEVVKLHLKMSASEMQNFALLFSFLVGDLVPHDDVWELYLHMRKIMDLVLCRNIQPQSAGLLRTLVHEHHQMFTKVFPDSSIKPKAHLWIHYGTVLLQSGPIINLSSSRFESKHRDKKKEANATASRKNITHTLCMKEQLSMCYRFMAAVKLRQNTEVGPSETIENISLLPNFNIIKNTLPATFTENCFKLNWAKVDGQMYKPKNCIILRLEDNEEFLPVFGIVKLVLQNDHGHICLICEVMLTTGFDLDFHAYKLYRNGYEECILVSNLYSPFPVIFVSSKAGCFGALRQAL